MVMKEEFNFSKAKKISKKHYDPDARKVHITLRVDGGDISSIRDEADRLGIPYQTLIGSILHRFAMGDLVDRKELSVALKEKAS